MKKTFFLTLLSAVSFWYGLYSSYKLIYQSRTPFVLECVGVALDNSKKYVISNSQKRDSETLVIDHPQGEGIMPDTLGYLARNPANNSFELRTGNELMLPLEHGAVNPFYAFARTSDDNLFLRPRYFDSNATIPADTLKTNGVKFNSIVGDRSSRVSIRLIDFEDKTYLKTASEGIGTQYSLQAGSTNRISVTCNQPINTETLRVYSFENTTSDKCESTIEITPSSTFNYTYKVINQRGETVKSGRKDKNQFEVAGYLFRITPKYTTLNTGFLILSILLLFGFQGFLIKSYARSVTPPVKSVIAIRLLLNCIAFLSVPLFITSLSITPNRWAYLVSLIVLNGSYFTSKRFLHNFNFDLSKTWERSIGAAVLFVTILMSALSSNESFFGIPILHVQKLVVLGLIFVSQGKFSAKSRQSQWIRFGLILLYTFILSLITSDLGSFLYTFIAIVLVETVKKSISPKTVFAVLLLVVGIFLSYSVAGGTFGDRKLYRLVAPYTSPASEKLIQANESDRETYSSLHLIQKNLIQGSVPGMNEIVIPAPMRSTSFSDFAFFWSLTIGKGVFVCMFFPVLLLLLYEFAFLLFISVRAIRINETQAFVLPINRESEFVRFLLAFAIVTFTYPVLSNLLLAPLTGQSFPCLSISIVEIGFLTLFLVQISSIFTNPRYVQPTMTVTYCYRDVIGSLKFAAFILASLILGATFTKLLDIKSRPDGYRWQKINKEFAGYQTENIDPVEKASLVKSALKAIGNDELTSLQKTKKPYLKNLASFYFSGKPYNQTHFEGSYFESTTDSLARQMNGDAGVSVDRKLVSGPLRPFGDVFSFTQMVNGRRRLAYTNDFYQSIPQDAVSIDADLTAELAKDLSGHVGKVGLLSNVGSIMVIRNDNGGIVANSTYPLNVIINSNEVHYNIGSLKKVILAYCALAIDPEYRHRVYNNKSFHDFIKWSDDVYAASLLRDLMLKHEQAFADVLSEDFNFPLTSKTEDAYFDNKPEAASYTKPLDRLNEIYRYSVGQQKPYQFIKVVEWYSRIASCKKVSLSYADREMSFENLSLRKQEMDFLRGAMGGVLSGTAPKVGIGLSENSLDPGEFIAKTGTAESSSKQYNSSSSFIIANDQFTIGIMLSGKIPFNSENLAAKDLFVSLIPTLKKYHVLGSPK